MANTKLKSFPEGTCVEIDDVIGGFRKLVLVTAGGNMYFDQPMDAPNATPLLMYGAMNPVNVGNALQWGLELAGEDAAQHAAFTALQQELLASKCDTLTYNRALYWSVQNRMFDRAQCLAAAAEANDQVKQSRARLDKLLARSQAA